MAAWGKAAKNRHPTALAAVRFRSATSDTPFMAFCVPALSVGGKLPDEKADSAHRTGQVCGPGGQGRPPSKTTSRQSSTARRKTVASKSFLSCRAAADGAVRYQSKGPVFRGQSGKQGQKPDIAHLCTARKAALRSRPPCAGKAERRGCCRCRSNT